MKKNFKNWNLFEILLLTISFSVITLCFIILPNKNWLSFISSLLGVFAVLLVAKGIVWAPVVNLVYGIFYIIISITQRYYGEAIIYGLVMTPLYIFSIVTWLKNRNDENENVVKVNKIKGIEYLYLSIATVILSITFYFVLKLLSTNELIVSTFSFTSSAFATYLMLRRCSYYAIGFIVDDVVSIVLWSLSVVNTGTGYIPSVLCFCIFLINDVYGFIHWKIEEKKQQKADIITENNN